MLKKSDAALEHVQLKLRELQGVDESIIVIGDFSVPLSERTDPKGKKAVRTELTSIS